MSDPSNTLTPDQQKLFRIFHPLAAGKEAEFREKRTRFVYYTSAEVATQMIRSCPAAAGSTMRHFHALKATDATFTHS
jgi:hypothetical protein